MNISLVVGLGVALLAGCAHQAEMPAQHRLADKGRTDYVIALAADHSPAEGRAAAELTHYLKEVTGAEFPVVTPEALGNRPCLAVGPGAVRALAPGLALDGLGQEGTVLESRPPHLFLTGGPGSARGTLYAVYSFLEDEVGCRWWSRTESDIPRRPTLAFPELHKRQIPTFEYRYPFWFAAFDQDWAARNKGNGYTLDAEHGGGVRYLGQGVHTFNALLPPAEYFPKHPEWFSEVDGKRLGPPSTAQWCLTNPELLAFCIQRVKEQLRDAPPESIASVSQNDAANRCQCPKCLAVEVEEGSASGPLLRFVNAVADAIKDDYPRAAVDTLAYNYTIKPPSLTKPRPNVIIRLCVSTKSLAFPLDNPRNREFAEDLRRWSEICKRLYIWNYTTCFGGYFMPFPNLRALGPDIRLFARNGVKGVFEQGNYTSPGGEFQELRAWVQAKLLWNPQADDRRLTQEFLDGYHGPAAPKIAEYIRLLHDTAEQADSTLGWSVPPTAPFLTLGLLTRADTLFQEAEAAVKDDPKLLRRAKLAHASVQYAVLRAWPTLRQEAQAKGLPWPWGNFNAAMAKFIAACAESHITNLNECNTATPEQFQSQFALPASLRSGVAVPELCAKLPADAWVDFQEDSFPQNPAYGENRPDPAASNGKAAWLSPTHGEWCAQLYLPISLWLDDPGQQWTAYIAVRADAPFSYGMYDVEQGKAVASHSFTATDLKDGAYHVYKVATTGLGYSRFVWVAPTVAPGKEGVWVDRIFLVKAGKDGQ